MQKALIKIWICLLTLYAPLELTRLIINYGLDTELIFELCFIWVAYLGVIVVLIRVVK